MEAADKAARRQDVPRVPQYQDFTAPDNKAGLPIQVKAAGKTILARVTIPDTMAGWRAEDVVGAHPGAVDTVLTTVMGQGTFFRSKQAAWLKSHTVEYFGLVPVGQEVTCEISEMRHRGDKEVMVDAFIHDGKGEVLARARGTYELLDMQQLSGTVGLIGNRIACAQQFAQPFEALAKSLT